MTGKNHSLLVNSYHRKSNFRCCDVVKKDGTTIGLILLSIASIGVNLECFVAFSISRGSCTIQRVSLFSQYRTSISRYNCNQFPWLLIISHWIWSSNIPVFRPKQENTRHNHPNRIPIVSISHWFLPTIPHYLATFVPPSPKTLRLSRSIFQATTSSPSSSSRSSSIFQNFDSRRNRISSLIVDAARDFAIGLS